jgi:hypothetical protein
VPLEGVPYVLITGIMSRTLALELNMSIRVDADLWKRFERAANLTQQLPDDILKSLMHDYAERHLPDRSKIIEPKLTNESPDLQIDLEDYLATPPLL